MKLILAFSRLIRWPNLVFIALTQLLYYYCIYQPVAASLYPADIYRVYQHTPLDDATMMNLGLFPPYLVWLMVLASVLIAAAGYIINDYFDINIDLINKPGRLVVDKIIQRRAAIIWHWLLSLAGIIISFYAAFKIGKWYIGVANAGTVMLLVFYSVSLKKKPLSGNILISFLTAWVILVLFLAFIPVVGGDFAAYEKHVYQALMPRLFRLTLLYSGFAFIATIIREAVKDMEDMEGDRQNGCRTIPLVWGLNAAKVYTAVWLVVLMAALLLVQVYVAQYGWYGGIVYSLLLLLAPLGLLLAGLRRAQSAAQFHRLSGIIKWVMLAGILSMLIYWRYASNHNQLI